MKQEKHYLHQSLIIMLAYILVTGMDITCAFKHDINKKNTRKQNIKEMIKIGILTYTSNFNFGTFFQAYATLCSLKKCFPMAKVEVINYQSKTKFQNVGYAKLNLKKHHLYPPFFIRHLRRQSSYREFEKQYLGIDAFKGFFSDSYDETSEFLLKKSFDFIVVGSDTVLNFYKWNYERKEPPIYWLPQEIKAKKIMLASSIGTDLNSEKMDTQMIGRLKQSVEGFSLISVRDPITYEFIAELSPKVVSRMSIIPDPTFLYEIDLTQAEEYLKRKKVNQDTPLIGLDIPISLPGIEESIIHFKSKGYRVASWRGHSKIVDYDFSDMNPFQWAGMFKRFSITLTNRFHASIFSLKNLTPVIAVDYKSKRISLSSQSKISMLLEDLDLKNMFYGKINLNDSSWMIKKMESAINECPQKKIQSGLYSMQNNYMAFINRYKETVL